MIPRLTCLILFVGTAAAAQTPFNSAIRGTVRDATSAVLARATVTIAAPSLIGGAQSTTTDARGDYRFSQLPPGIYVVTVNTDSFRPARWSGVEVAAGATMTVDFSLEVAGPRDELVIAARAPVVDVTSAGVPARLDENLIANLPTSRSIASLINLVPGIGADVAFGGSQQGNEILIDGLRTTSSALQEPVLRANQNWVQEMTVVGPGASAEYGGFTGVAANAVLRSGSNRYSGLGEWWTTSPGWLSDNTR